MFNGDIDDLVGVVQLRRIVPRLANNTMNREALLAATREPYFTAEGTSLNGQLLTFRNTGQRLAFVVDEYGDIQGMVTVEDVLKQIVGELTQNTPPFNDQVQKEPDDSYIVDASASVRVLNRMMNWHLPTEGPTTLNGIIIEQLENFPAPGTDVTVGDYPIRVLDASQNVIKTVRVKPPVGRSAEVGSVL